MFLSSLFVSSFIRPPDPLGAFSFFKSTGAAPRRSTRGSTEGEPAQVSVIAPISAQAVEALFVAVENNVDNNGDSSVRASSCGFRHGSGFSLPFSFYLVMCNISGSRFGWLAFIQFSTVFGNFTFLRLLYYTF